MNHTRHRARMKWNRRAETAVLLAMIPVVFLLSFLFAYGAFQ